MLTAEYFKTPGNVPLENGEEIKEISVQGEYYDKTEKMAKKCFLVFTDKHLFIYVEAQIKAGLFKKKTGARAVYTVPYTEIAQLKRHRVGSDDTYCCAVLKSGEEVAFNLFGEVFGPLALKIVTYSGLDIPRVRNL